MKSIANATTFLWQQGQRSCASARKNQTEQHAHNMSSFVVNVNHVNGQLLRPWGGLLFSVFIFFFGPCTIVSGCSGFCAAAVLTQQLYSTWSQQCGWAIKETKSKDVKAIIFYQHEVHCTVKQTLSLASEKRVTVRNSVLWKQPKCIQQPIRFVQN